MRGRLSRGRGRARKKNAIPVEGISPRGEPHYWKLLHHEKLRKPTRRRKISAGDTTIATLRFVTFRHGTNRAFSSPPPLLLVPSPERWAPLRSKSWRTVGIHVHDRAVRKFIFTKAWQGRQAGRQPPDTYKGEGRHSHRNIFAHTFFPPRGYTIQAKIFDAGNKKGSLPLALK